MINPVKEIVYLVCSLLQVSSVLLLPFPELDSFLCTHLLITVFEDPPVLSQKALDVACNPRLVVSIATFRFYQNIMQTKITVVRCAFHKLLNVLSVRPLQNTPV